MEEELLERRVVELLLHDNTRVVISALLLAWNNKT